MTGFADVKGGTWWETPCVFHRAETLTSLGKTCDTILPEWAESMKLSGQKRGRQVTVKVADNSERQRAVAAC